MGEGAYSVLKAASRYMGKPLGFSCKTFKSGECINIGELSIMPFLVDHSAFDSYMFIVTDGFETALYTGDFRSSGRKSFDGFLCRLPKQVDTIICHGNLI